MSRMPREMRESSVWISGRRAFQTEGTASAKALMQEHACPTVE